MLFRPRQAGYAVVGPNRIGTSGNELKRPSASRQPGFFLALLLAVVISNTVAAQSQQTTPVTVSQAVKEAVEKNFVLLAERYDLSIADARIVTARLRPNPVLSLYTDLQPWLGRGRPRS